MAELPGWPAVSVRPRSQTVCLDPDTCVIGDSLEDEEEEAEEEDEAEAEEEVEDGRGSSW